MQLKLWSWLWLNHKQFTKIDNTTGIVHWGTKLGVYNKYRFYFIEFLDTVFHFFMYAAFDKNCESLHTPNRITRR